MTMTGLGVLEEIIPGPTLLETFKFYIKFRIFLSSNCISFFPGESSN